MAKGTPRSAQYGHGRTRAVPSLPQVLAENGLPEVAPLRKGERIMLDRKRLDTFYRELQTASRIKVPEHREEKNACPETKQEMPWVERAADRRS